MTRHDEPAEGDVAGVEEVLAAHEQGSGWQYDANDALVYDCDCGAISPPFAEDGAGVDEAAVDAAANWHRAHLADALRDLIAAAEQRGRVAALLPFKQLAREWDLTEFPDEPTAATMRLDLTRIVHAVSATERAK